MTTHNFYFVITVAGFTAVHISMAVYYLARARRISEASWDELIGRLVRTDNDRLCLVAREVQAMDERGDALVLDEQAEGLEAGELWDVVGGLEGLQVLEKNSEVLIEIAFYVQRWYPEAVVISERLRQDARELQWHVSRLKGAAKTGNLQISFPFYARRAVATYYVMTRRVLRLYEAGHFSMLSQLQQAL